MKIFSVDFTKAIRGMRLTKDLMGACFDVPEDLAELVKVAHSDNFKYNFKSIEICKHVPLLQEENRQSKSQDTRPFNGESKRPYGNNNSNNSAGARTSTNSFRKTTTSSADSNTKKSRNKY